MCGICGELRFDGRPPDRDTLDRMLISLANRGPDDSDSYFSGPLAFGHRRLAVIDLSSQARQPMVDDSEHLSIVFNGSIYNYPALREELRDLGHRFRSNSDTEVILRAYAQWGEDCLARFNGMFAFAIWSARQQTLFLARDRMGIKPLYYTIDQRRIRFASTPAALLTSGEIDTTLDSVALHHQFTLHAVVPAPRTILRGVSKMLPAHSLSITAEGHQQLRRYWHLSARRPPTPRTEAEWIEAIHLALRAAIKCRLDVADVPVGVLLSGGLDSSLLVAFMAAGGATDLKTFTVGFEDQPEEQGNEFAWSDMVANTFATDHHKFFISNSELIDRLPEAVTAMSEPMFGQDVVAFYLLSEQVSRSIKVVQSGQGADEVFAGYFWYPQMHAAGLAEADVTRFSRRYFDRSHAELLSLIDPSLHTETDVTTELIAARLEAMDADEYLDRVLALDITTLIVDDPIKRVDNMTMSWGLEARVPFLDHELVELAAQMPPELKLRRDGKYPLKKIADGLLPDAVVNRPKRYFPVPALKYVRGELLGFMQDILHSQAARNRGLYQRNYIDKLLAAPEQYLTRLQGSKLWQATLLELWLQQHIDQL